MKKNTTYLLYIPPWIKSDNEVYDPSLYTHIKLISNVTNFANLRKSKRGKIIFL